MIKKYDELSAIISQVTYFYIENLQRFSPDESSDVGFINWR